MNFFGLQAEAEQLKSNPHDILNWAVETFKERVCLACSFGPEDIVLLDMMMKTNRNMPHDVFYLDTGLHFPETYATRDALAEKYDLEFIRVVPRLTLEEQAISYGEKLWERDPDACCHLRKVKPLAEILKGYDGWITGIRREQSFTRAQAEVLEWDAKFNMVKLNPLAFWKEQQVWNYIHQHGLPYNPLHDQNYPSIGCQVCTLPVRPGEDARAGRWNGRQKTECGLHPSSPV